MRASWRENAGRIDEATGINESSSEDEVEGEVVGDDGEVDVGVDVEEVSEAEEAISGVGSRGIWRNGRRLDCFLFALVNRANDFVMGI